MFKPRAKSGLRRISRDYEAAVFQRRNTWDMGFRRNSDRLLAIKAPKKLYESTLRDVLEGVNVLLRNAYPEALKHSGTTLTLAHYNGEDALTVAHLGDCRASLCVKPQECQPAILPLTQDHTPDQPDELSRIQAQGGFVTYMQEPSLGAQSRLVARVDGVAAISRSFGLHALAGISAEPDIRRFSLSQHGINLQNGDQALLCVESDGSHMGFSSGSHLYQVETLFQQTDEVTPLHLAQLFGKQACATKRNRDDITIIVTRLQTGMKHGAVLAVLDGHGTQGRTIARSARSLLKSELTAAME